MTDPEPTEQESDTQPDAASRTDVQCPLCRNVVLPYSVLDTDGLMDLPHQQVVIHWLVLMDLSHQQVVIHWLVLISLAKKLDFDQ